MNPLAYFIRKSTPFAISIYCDGNSTTEYPDNYTIGMKAYLESVVPHLTATVTNVSLSSQTTANMLANVSTQILANNPDIVTMSIYLNDLYAVPDALRTDTRNYINAVLSHTNPNGQHPRLLVMTDNASGENLTEPDARPIAQQIATKDTVLGVFNEYKTIPYVWIADRFQKYYELGFESPLFFSKLRSDDKVHPNAEGYSTIDEPLIYPIVRNMAENIRIFK